MCNGDIKTYEWCYFEAQYEINDLSEKLKMYLPHISEIICGGDCVIIQLNNGKIMGYGQNWCGQLGLGDKKNRQ